MDEEFHYSALGNEEGGESWETERKKQATGVGIWTKCDCWGVGVAVTLLALFTLATMDIVLGYKQSVPTPLQKSSGCGSTPKEAKQLGCVFDLMSWCWLPPACHDESLALEHLQYGPWDWYEDVAGTRPVTEEEAETGEITPLYVEESFHQIHCIYIWKKQHRAYLGGGVIDDYVAGFNHTVHCSKTLLRQVPWHTNITTSVGLKYPTCNDIRSIPKDRVVES
jgi:hypothetical protein